MKEGENNIIEGVLSSREMKVASLVARGMPNKEIANIIGTTEGVIKKSVHNILKKTELTSRFEIISYWIKETSF